MKEIMRLIEEEVDKATQKFLKENGLYLRVRHTEPISGGFGHSGGAKFTLEFSAYLEDEPYRTITGYKSSSEIAEAKGSL